jgi:hypothetical protein
MEQRPRKWSAIELSNECRKAETEVTFMTNSKGDMAGLSTAKAEKLLEQYGSNELTPRKNVNFFQ